MPQIRDRSEDNAKRKNRLAKQKKGPGVFVYDGNAFDTEWVPTVKRVGKNVPLLDATDMPVLDQTGRQQFRPSNAAVTDGQGRPVLGGEPKINKIPIKVFKLRDYEFSPGEKVYVDNTNTALKLRCMACFEEIEVEPEAEAKPVEKMKLAELVEFAQNEGIEVPAGATKAQIIELLKARED